MCASASLVAGSVGSVPAMALSKAAASATVRVMGPAVSCSGEIGTMPVRETRPTVGFRPTIPVIAAGQVIEPSVSVPMARAASPAAIAAPDPADEPQAVRSKEWGLRTKPPAPLHPLMELVERKFAHSDRFVLPRTTAPASVRRLTNGASRVGTLALRARDPAVVAVPSNDSRLSFSRMVTPCRGPRSLPARRSASSFRASARAWVFSARTALSFGPERSIRSIRSR